MGYSIYIGDAKPFFEKDDGYLEACWSVDSITNDDAPEFPNDEMTGKSNNRHPSYTGWSDFCRTAGIYDIFFGDEGLMQSHPGCTMFNEEHLAEIKKALQHWQSISTRHPGFDGFPKFDKENNCWVEPKDKGKYDPILARLLWLDYWMTWAIENCETPAIQNT